MLHFNPPNGISPLHWRQTFPVVNGTPVEEEFALFDGMNDANEIVYTALVTRDTDPPVSISTLKRTCCTHHLVCPLRKYSNTTVDGVKIITLLYHPFKTLKAYMDSDRNAIQEPSFAKVMKGIITGLNNLHSSAYVPWILNGNTMVVEENKKGGLLFVKTEQPRHRLDSDCNADFVAIHNTIRDLCKEQAVECPGGLETLLKCLPRALTKAQRKRLLLAPYFYSDRELVRGHIGQMYKAMTTCEEFRNYLKKVPVTKCIEKIRANPHKEVEEVWKWNSVPVRNLFEVFTFIRHCMQHLDERWNELPNHVKEAYMKQATSSSHPPTASQQLATSHISIPIGSPLMSYSSLFLEDLLYNLSPDCLNKTYRLTYKVLKKGKEGIKNPKLEDMIERIPVLDMEG